MIATLNPGDGMSVERTTPKEREDALKRISEITGQDEVTKDRIKYGFYIGSLNPTPIADYGNNMVTNQITLKDIG